MEAEWVVARYRLRQLRQQHPEWSQVRLAQELGMSLSWVKKWQPFVMALEQESLSLADFASRSRAPKRVTRKVVPAVVEKVLSLRDAPPDGLQRTPGPKTILYFLHRDEELVGQGLDLPTSSSTIWRILDENERIVRPSPVEHEPLNRAAPLQEWQIDFKTVSTVKPEAGTGKRVNVVETFNMIDTGTSIWLAHPVRLDFNAETALEAVVETLRVWGVPTTISFDRDPRFVTSWRADLFPSPLVRLLMNLGIEVDIHPPHQPHKNAFVERFNRTVRRKMATRIVLGSTTG